MEQRKSVIFSCGRSHFAEGVSGESHPSAFLSRAGQPSESPRKMYDDICGDVELIHRANRECEQAIICESPYLKESKGLFRRYEEHIEILLDSYFERALIINTPLSSLFAVGLLDGVVADLGHTQSTVAFCEGGEVVFSSAHAIRDSCSLKNGGGEMFEDAAQDTTRKFHRRMVESFRYDSDWRKSSDQVVHLLPDGALVNNESKDVAQSQGAINVSEKPAVPQNLLCSSLNTKSNLKQANSLDTLVKHVVASCKQGFERQTSSSKRTFAPFVFAGGLSQIPDIQTQLAEELSRDKLEFQVFSPVCATDIEKQYQPQTLGYKGASILGEFLTHNSYISKKEFAEHGGRIVNVKCMNIP